MKEAKAGTIRIGTNLKTYEFKNKTWKTVEKEFPSLIKIVSLFKSHNKFNELIDKKNPSFLKGQIFKGKVQGARLNILPNGEKLDKAYSILQKI